MLTITAFLFTFGSVLGSVWFACKSETAQAPVSSDIAAA